MELLGARVQAVDAGARTLKEATSAAIRDWVTNVGDTHYVIGSVVGPAPYPALVRDLQRVIGDEARAQMLEREGRLPARVVACVGGGLQRARHLHRLPRGPGRRAGRRGGRRRGDPRAVRRSKTRRSPDRRRPRRRAARRRSRRSCRTRRARSSRRTRSPPASTTPAPALNTPSCATAAAPATWPSPTARRSPPSARSRAWRASSRRLETRPRAGLGPGPVRRRARSGVPLRPRRQGPRRGAGAVKLLAPAVLSVSALVPPKGACEAKRP